MPSQPKREPVNWREGRRLRAWELSQQGWKQADIARALRCDTRCRQPVAQSRPCRRCRCALSSSAARRGVTPDPRPTRPVAGALGPRCPGSWVPGRRVDPSARRARHQTALRRDLSSRPYRPPPQAPGLELAAARDLRYPAQRRTCRRMVGHALAGAEKKARDEGRTIVWIDEAAFYLLPACVRTWAPRGRTPTLRVPLTRYSAPL